MLSSKVGRWITRGVMESMLEEVYRWIAANHLGFSRPNKSLDIRLNGAKNRRLRSVKNSQSSLSRQESYGKLNNHSLQPW